MNVPTIPPTGGQNKTITLMRKILDELRSLRIVSSPDIRVSKGTDGTSLTIVSKGGGGGSSVPRWG